MRRNQCERKKCGIGNSVNMKPRKIHKTKKLQSKRKAASFNTFEEKEVFVKITSNARA